MNRELLKIVLNRAELMFNSAFDNARQVSNRFAAVESANTDEKDTDLGSLIAQLATRQEEQLYRLDQAAPSPPFIELSKLHEPVCEFRSVLAELSSGVERGEPLSELRASFCNIERAAKSGYECVKGIRVLIAKQPSANDTSTTSATADTAKPRTKATESQRASLLARAFGMPECFSAEEAENWSKDFSRFVNHAECDFLRQQREIHYGEFSEFEALFEAFFKPGEVVTINGTMASNATPFRKVLFDRLNAHSQTLDKFVQKLCTHLRLTTSQAITNLELPHDREHFTKLTRTLTQLHSWPEITGARGLWLRFEPFLKTPRVPNESDRIKIPVTTEVAQSLLDESGRVQACLAELISEGEKALRIGLVPPDFRTNEERPKPIAQRTPPVNEDSDFNTGGEESIEELEARTPPFDRGSGEWVNGKEAAEIEGVERDTLKSDRSNKKKSKDGRFGRDKRGRIWRKQGTAASPAWYLVTKLRKRSSK